MDDDVFLPVPATAEELASRWASRDAEYAKLRPPLDDDRAEAIRQARMDEARRLPSHFERGRMYARAQTWAPPVHPDHGSLRDYWR